MSITTSRDSPASNGFEYTFPYCIITLNIHSSLKAIGFMAVNASKLAEKDISTNHDHLFVPLGREEEALEALKNIASEAQKTQRT